MVTRSSLDSLDGFRPYDSHTMIAGGIVDTLVGEVGIVSTGSLWTGWPHDPSGQAG